MNMSPEAFAELCSRTGRDPDGRLRDHKKVTQNITRNITAPPLPGVRRMEEYPPSEGRRPNPPAPSPIVVPAVTGPNGAAAVPSREAFRTVLLDLAPDLPSISGLRLKDEDRLQAELVASVWASVRHEGWALGVWSVQNTVPVFRRKLPGGKPDPADRAPIVAGARLKAMGLLSGVFDLCAIWWAGPDEAAGIGFLESKNLKGSPQNRMALDRGRLKAKAPLAPRRSLLGPRQRLFLRLIETAGIPGAPYWSVEEGRGLLQRWAGEAAP